MDTQDQSKTTTSSGHICHRCGWPFPKSHPSSKHRRAHKRICGTIEGYPKLIDSEAVSDDEHYSDEEDIEITPSPKIEKKIIDERSSKSEDDLFSDAVTEFSDGGFSTPGAEERFFDTTKLLFSPVELIKGDDNLEVFQTPDTEDKNGPHSHKDKIKLVDDVAPSKSDVAPSKSDKDQEKKEKEEEEEAEYILSVPSDIPIVDQAETLLQDFKNHDKTIHSNVEDKIEESQTYKNGESTMESEKVDDGVSVLNEESNHEIVKESESESVIECEEKIVESVIEGVDSKDSGSSSRNSLEANWGSVSVLSTASYDVESKDKSQLDKQDAFEGPLMEVEPNEENVDQNQVKVKVKVEEDSQPLKSEGVLVGNNESEGRKRNEEAIAKVTNWSTSEQASGALKNLVSVSEAKSLSPKELKIQKDDDEVEVVEKISEVGKSNLVNNEKISEVGKSNLVNKETSPPKYIGEGKKVRKKAKGKVSWVPFACCSSINVS
ncbi:uncharacterized protein LOC111887665 [Lactuca sativa]|uniref:C2H2-type domain-containing protein n=1 Tax=Lactuca sativa TaxID=4236 RepID=A0A9R1WBS9_LACSA|nr:uncharacterized protein LOC111887665 [Lactuca sativa]KAJ0221008.1 hypothetical protein LSAT_V11C200067220 [Lactuca sativa]